ncbi:TIGR04255 family protein [Blastococcus sp. SYSU D00695]
MALDFGTHADVVFDRAPLQVVLCQIKFPPIYSLMGEAGIAGFQEAIRHLYPKTNKSVDAQFQVSDQQMSVMQSAPTFQFQSEDELWTVSLSVDFIALETPKYSHFGEFNERLERILAALARTVRPAATTRIGLRKANRLLHPNVSRPADWTGLLRPELLGVVAAQELPTPVQFAFSELRFQDEDNFMVVRHGLDPAAEQAYVVDVDYFTERPYSLDEAESAHSLLRHYSDGITSFFHWCLEPRMYDYLKPHPRTEESS